jgi:hypothetical protein
MATVAQPPRSQSHLDTFNTTHHAHALQPSAMPPPPPSISPKAFHLNSRFLKKPNIPEKEDVFYTPLRDRQSKDRAALALIDTNQCQASGSGSKLPTVYHTSIPKAPVIPDVFTPLAGGQKRGNENKDREFSKERDGGDGRPVKRRALDELATGTGTVTASGTNPARTRDSKISRSAFESEQEKWRAKWLKSFPTLTFHFEVEAEQGIGKGLKARAIKMGAVSHSISAYNGADKVEN